MLGQHVQICLLSIYFNDCIICITCSDKSCNCHMYMVCIGYQNCITCTYLGLGRRWKTAFKALLAKMNESSKVHVFINVGLTLIGYRKPPKQGYCFIMRTSVVPVSVSIKITHCWTEK